MFFKKVMTNPSVVKSQATLKLLLLGDCWPQPFLRNSDFTGWLVSFGQHGTVQKVATGPSDSSLGSKTLG